MSDVFSELAALGLTLPDPPKPGGYYESVRVLDYTAHVAVQFPFVGTELQYQGRLGRELTTIQGYEAAQLCALNVLAQLHKYVGFDSIAGLNRIEALMQTVDGWDDFPKVLDGASKLFLDTLGDAGRHARALAGVERLPLNAPLTLTATFTLKKG
jgi:enamine deaminase RidA (YjgF/YER057c/UK114 family)